MAKLHIFAGSVYGNAQHVAEEVTNMLTSDGIECELFTDPSVDDFKQAGAILVITSTTGQGDIPPNLEFVHSELKDSFPLLTDKPFAVAALGDSSYDTFCGGGQHFQELLSELQAKPVAEMLKVDALETFEPEQMVMDWVAGIKDKLV
ncbi:flavodoxin [Alteromonas ponticola]|uniref:Flavodoxin n=1 Tax=Alteromonas ponticola TaxID=2720613 RepID=A0ABX1QZS2_9ALTE|nr:flavodoxin [Alteromonas ponticola]NMH59719.1 flavodoxin [Alteromonas ponticola]